jgi:RHS repeat-associated protein
MRILSFLTMSFITSLFFLKSCLLYGQQNIKLEEEYPNYLSGVFDVNQSGAALYNVPLVVTPGTAGMQPVLSLNYSSQGYDGLVGIGWSLSGLSVITRCPSTIAQDGLSHGIDFTGLDKYCLDGERLVAVEGSYGGNGTEYSTEQRNFSKIVSYGKAGEGPRSFKVQTKSGLIYEYGETKDSRIAAQGKASIFCWTVNKIQDTKGNYITIRYEKEDNNGDYRPSQIDYTGNEKANLVPYASVKFYYEVRSLITPYYISGSLVQHTKILKSIRTFYKRDLVRRYDLTFESKSSNYYLKKVQEYSNDDKSSRPIEFEWSNFPDGVFKSGRYGYPGWNFGQPSTWTTISGDFNGDGKTDLIRMGATYLHTMFSNGDGSFIPGQFKYDGMNFGQPSSWETFSGDFNGDGKTDFVRICETYLHTFISKGDGTFSISKYEYPGWNFGRPSTWTTISGDFNGDGKTDLIRMGATYLHTMFSNGDGSFIPGQFKYDGMNFGQPSSWETFSGDFNGDGKTDFVRICETYLHTFISKGDGTFSISKYEYPGWNFGRPSTWTTISGDFNGDGKTDLIRMGATYLHTMFSKGDGSFVPGQFKYEGMDFGQPSTWETFSEDFNGDNKTDFVRMGSHYLHPFISNGDGTFSISKYEYPGWDFGQPSSWETLTGDYNGDGKTDVVRIGGTYLHTLISDTSFTHPNLIIKIKTGNGAAIKIDYKPLTNEAVYKKRNLSKYPEMDFQGALYVVANYTYSNGTGGVNKVSYNYEGAILDLQGRGFRGFSTVKIENVASKIINTTYYETNYRYTGNNIKRIVTTLKSGKVISEINNTLKYVDGKNGTGFSFVKKSVEKNYDLTGNLVGYTITQKDYDGLGNLKNITVGNGITKILTKNIYLSNKTYGSNWITGRLSNAQVIKSIKGQEDQIKTSSFNYDAISGLLIKEIVHASAKSQLEKTYEYDDYGNIIKSTISGDISENPSEARSKISVYDSLGRFLVELINEAGQKSYKEYDLMLGMTKRYISPNKTTTTWEYNKFGNLVKEIYGDGRFIKRTRKICTNKEGIPLAVYKETISSSNNAPVTIYYDLLDREIVRKTIAFEGHTIIKKTYYNALGQITSKIDPYYEEAPQKNRFRTSYQFDLLGRLGKVIEPGNIITITKYSGLRTIISNPLGQKQILIKNLNGQIISSVDNSNKIIFYTYDASGQLTRVYDHLKNVSAYKYDERGNRVEFTNSNGEITRFQYDAFNDLIQQTNSDESSVRFTYDNLGRMIKQAGKEDTTQFIFDSSRHGIGMISKIIGNRSSITYTYDKFGRPIEKNQFLAINNGKTYTTRQEYDEVGKIKKLIYPSGYAIEYFYDSWGYLSQMRDMNNKLLWQVNKINENNQLEEEYYGSGISVINSYIKTTKEIKNITVKSSSQVLQNLDFKFDKLGNLKSRTDNIRALDETFDYDSLNRLIKCSVMGTNPSSMDVKYDSSGNIIYKSDVGNFIYGENNFSGYQVTSIQKNAITQNTFNYDLKGNRTTSLDDTIGYTSFDKPTHVRKGNTQLYFSYGPSHELLTKTTILSEDTTNLKIYIGNLYEEEEINGKVEKIHYIQSPYGFFAINSEGEVGKAGYKYLLKDHLGSLTVITNEIGEPIEHYSYDAWGNRRNPDTWNTLPSSQKVYSTDRGFTGHKQLDEVGLINMNARIYDPSIGKFLNVDPFVQNPAYSQSFNSYSYVMNNPATLIDPIGCFSWKGLFNDITSVSWDIAKLSPYGAQWNLAYKINPELTLVGTQIGLAFATSEAGPVYSGAIAGFGTAFLGTMAGGGTGTDALGAGLKAGLIGGVTAGLTYAAGDLPYAVRIPVHGAIQGASTAAQGGKFEHGFYAGAFSAASSPYLDEIFGDDFNGRAGKLIAAAVIGGTAAEIGGGKFSNGAISGAYIMMYNDFLHPDVISQNGEGELTEEEVSFGSDAFDMGEKITESGEYILGKQGNIYGSKVLGTLSKGFKYIGNAATVGEIATNYYYGNQLKALEGVVGLVPYASMPYQALKIYIITNLQGSPQMIQYKVDNFNRYHKW